MSYYPGAMPPTIFRRVWDAIRYSDLRLVGIFLKILEGICTIAFLMAMGYVLVSVGFTKEQSSALVMVVYLIVTFCKKDA